MAGKGLQRTCRWREREGLRRRGEPLLRGRTLQSRLMIDDGVPVFWFSPDSSPPGPTSTQTRSSFHLLMKWRTSICHSWLGKDNDTSAAAFSSRDALE